MDTLNILVVEDDRVCVEFIGVALRSMGAKIAFTDKISEALSMLHGNWHAVWLDLSLTDSSADNTLLSIPHIRQICPNTTLLVVSGYGDTYKRKALDLGADVYASKLDLEGFNQKLVANLFTQAAVRAMERGVDTTALLKSLGSFFENLNLQSRNP